MRALLTASLLFLGGAFAADPAPETVTKLIAQLGSPNYQAREAASRALAALGGPALPALRKAAATSTDAEAARRAADLAAAITRRLDNDKAIAPTLVELNFEDVALASVLAELQKKSGGRVAFDDLDALGAKVTVKTGGKVPFWEALTKVTAAAGLEVVPTAAPMVSASATGSREARLITVRQAAVVNLMAQQKAALAQLRAAQSGIAKNAINEKQKADELLKRQKREVELALARLMEAQAQQLAALDRTARSTSAPVNTRVIALRPKSAKPNPSCVSGAVRIEAIPYPAAALATVPRDTIPIVLHASPEPRLTWERIESVRVTKAADDAGRELAVAADDETLSARVFPVQGGAIVIGGNGVNLVPSRDPRLSQGFAPSATQALVRLKTTGTPESLKALEGVVRGVIRTGPEELAAVVGLDKKPTVSAFGVNGVALTVTLTERPEGESYDVEAVLRYDPAEVQVAGQPQIEEQVLNRGRGRVIVRGQARIGGGFRPGGGGGIFPGGGSGVGPGKPSAFGMTVTDAAGKPYTLTVVSSRRSHDRTSSEVTDRVMLLARPAGAGQGAPAKLSVAGTRAKVVAVPFQLTDVPAAAGTAEVPDEVRQSTGR